MLTTVSEGCQALSNSLRSVQPVEVTNSYSGATWTEMTDVQPH